MGSRPYSSRPIEPYNRSVERRIFQRILRETGLKIGRSAPVAVYLGEGIGSGFEVASNIAALVWEARRLDIERIVNFEQLMDYNALRLSGGGFIYTDEETTRYLREQHGVVWRERSLTRQDVHGLAQLDPNLRILESQLGMLVLHKEIEHVDGHAWDVMRRKEKKPYRADPLDSSHFWESLVEMHSR